MRGGQAFLPEVRMADQARAVIRQLLRGRRGGRLFQGIEPEWFLFVKLERRGLRRRLLDGGCSLAGWLVLGFVAPLLRPTSGHTEHDEEREEKGRGGTEPARGVS